MRERKQTTHKRIWCRTLVYSQSCLLLDIITVMNSLSEKACFLYSKHHSQIVPTPGESFKWKWCKWKHRTVKYNIFMSHHDKHHKVYLSVLCLSHDERAAERSERICCKVYVLRFEKIWPEKLFYDFHDSVQWSSIFAQMTYNKRKKYSLTRDMRARYRIHHINMRTQMMMRDMLGKGSEGA